MPLLQTARESVLHLPQLCSAIGAGGTRVTSTQESPRAVSPSLSPLEGRRLCHVQQLEHSS